MAKKIFLARLRTHLSKSSKEPARGSASQATSTPAVQLNGNNAGSVDTITPDPPSALPFSTPINPQHQSALFSTFPAEIRNRIFILATTAYPDPQRPYASEDWHFRPDTPCHLRIDTALLRTCRRAYDEAHLVPIANNTHTFWYPDSKINPAGNQPVYLAKYPAKSIGYISVVHLIGPHGELLHGLHTALRFMDDIGAQLTRLKISFRHTGKIRHPEKLAQLILGLRYRRLELAA